MSGLAPKIPGIDRIDNFRTWRNHRSPGWADVKRDQHHHSFRKLPIELEVPEKTQDQLDREYELWVLKSLGLRQ